MLMCLKYSLKRRALHTDLSLLEAISLLSARELQEEVHYNPLFEEWAQGVPATFEEGDYEVLLVVNRQEFGSVSAMVSYELVKCEISATTLSSTPLVLRCGSQAC